ncbi:type II toxin-antitoxin system RelE/ParE family toxin [Methylobacterium nonmethylotrophicum]|uniref:Type II toxin-antitoxin system RelE/ParE family toxin n=1 Tax=Methylobacterium nonmethylotrophicum TaxID=1141884 RepID=A0A4Z0NW32_9HYPH|nr:type II toxin-antitoxin system RelE/ParE family toxin [Methylobacterium nonmethylotrophicum]TGE00998.1 type II toxin-antitoxin system RelE/ParE family toxin [Methylobacterium nonmethylotrophicum]
MTIRSFHHRLTEPVFRGRCPEGFPADLFKAARRRLVAPDAATSLDDLKVPTSNRLHALERDRAGQHAIAVNDQFRICVVWTASGPERVEFTDCH